MPYIYKTPEIHSEIMFFGGRVGKGTITNHLGMTVTCVQRREF